MAPNIMRHTGVLARIVSQFFFAKPRASVNIPSINQSLAKSKSVATKPAQPQNLMVHSSFIGLSDPKRPPEF